MQKKLIALAVAGLASTAAFAQSNVTVYGIADMYYGNFHANTSTAANGKSVSALNSGGLSTSRIGFRGTEDLGNGLKAIFQLESALNLDANGTTAGNSGLLGANRNSYVGLTGGFGTAIAGRLETPFLNWNIKYTPLGGSVLNSLDQVTNNNGVAQANADRVDNAVAYVSPNLGGITMKAAYSAAGEVKTQAGNNKRDAYLLSADYDNGPLSVGAVYRNLGDLSNSGDKSGNKQWGLGASYNFNVVKLFAAYQAMDLNNDTVDGIKAYAVGAAVPMGNGALVATFGDSKSKTAAQKLGSKAYTVAYTYSLSKRTTAYAGYTHIDGKQNQTVTFAGAQADANKAVSGVALGLRHSF